MFLEQKFAGAPVSRITLKILPNPQKLCLRLFCVGILIFWLIHWYLFSHVDGTHEKTRSHAVTQSLTDEISWDCGNFLLATLNSSLCMFEILWRFQSYYSNGSFKCIFQYFRSLQKLGIEKKHNWVSFSTFLMSGEVLFDD